MKKISINEALKMPYIKKEFRTKEEFAIDFLINFREFVLKNKIADFGDLIPNKNEISNLLKVSTGTVQSAIRYIEDSGLFCSKQCIGTMIKNPSIQKQELKMFSKKDLALIEIKKFLIKHKYEENEIIPPIIELSGEIRISANTCRLAINELILKGVLEKKIFKKNTAFILKTKLKLSEQEKNVFSDFKNKNLPKILKENIKKYLLENFKTGDKIPTNDFFAKMYNVSTRTINTAFHELSKEKIILSRRGAYGSIFLNTGINETKSFMSKPKSKSELKNSYDYKWELAFQNIKKYILKNSDVGDKIPTIKQFAKLLSVSTTTVKKAVSELSKEGILYTQKGKYGGIFVVELPQKEDSYQWLAINPKYFD